MEKFIPRKFRAKITEKALDDGGVASFTFEVISIKKDKIYEEENPKYLSTKQRGVVIDDNSCWWHYGTASFNQRFEEVK